MSIWLFHINQLVFFQRFKNGTMQSQQLFSGETKTPPSKKNKHSVNMNGNRQRSLSSILQLISALFHTCVSVLNFKKLHSYRKC
jgi:hypothetical protein